MSDNIIETHATCTSTPLDRTPGSSPEHINMSVLNELYRNQTGVNVSDDPVVARIQREQALVRDKRNRRQNKDY